MAERDGRSPAALRLCRACDHFSFPGARGCPHCGADLDAADADYRGRMDEARLAFALLRALMERRAGADEVARPAAEP